MPVTVYIAVGPDGRNASAGSTAESPKRSEVPGAVLPGAPGGTDTATEVGNDEVPGADDGVDDEQAVSTEPSAMAARSAPDTRVAIGPRARRGPIRGRGRRMRDRGARDDGDVLTCVR